ncbi:hypothetical protein ACFOOL_03210 [Devosia honganensis]|uniref:DUF2802 domain-containing protein n=1 Tax=Devosia honganensis TaxID=1610527 RepID=A0ABV7WWS9_9HYPH
MLIENTMYFALGLLVAGLVALVILPAVWKRAVRLTKRRIEAATPITMAEFRADKDQLRAEFALSTRRLEMTIETLRRRLAEQSSDANQQRVDLGALRVERESHQQVVQELESREAALRARVLELEKEGADLAQRLRMRERDLETLRGEIEVPPPSGTDPRRQAEPEDLVTAEARIASAEDSLNALLAETENIGEQSGSRPVQLLADKLSMEEELETLRTKVGEVEATILANWESERFEEAELREKLNDIAAGVSRLVYAVHDDAPIAALPEESLFDRVQRFADDGEGEDMLPSPATAHRGSVSDRLAALREIQER